MPLNSHMGSKNTMIYNSEFLLGKLRNNGVRNRGTQAQMYSRKKKKSEWNSISLLDKLWGSSQDFSG